MDSRDQARRLSPDCTQVGRPGEIVHAPGLRLDRALPAHTQGRGGAANRVVVVDGEAVCCDDAGVAVFEKLHSRAYDEQVYRLGRLAIVPPVLSVACPLCPCARGTSWMTISSARRFSERTFLLAN